MYKLCKTEQSAQRQRQLEEGLLTAMKTKRYEEITISDLCEQMDIPRKSFYRYFSSKDGALHALIDHTLLDFEQHTGILSGNAAGDAHQDLRPDEHGHPLAPLGLRGKRPGNGEYCDDPADQTPDPGLRTRARLQVEPGSGCQRTPEPWRKRKEGGCAGEPSGFPCAFNKKYSLSK